MKSYKEIEYHKEPRKSISQRKADISRQLLKIREDNSVVKYGIMYDGKLLGVRISANPEGADYCNSYSAVFSKDDEDSQPWLANKPETAQMLVLYNMPWFNSSKEHPGHGGLDPKKMKPVRVRMIIETEELDQVNVYQNDLLINCADCGDWNGLKKYKDKSGYSCAMIGRLPKGETIESLQRWVNQRVFYGRGDHHRIIKHVIAPTDEMIKSGYKEAQVVFITGPLGGYD